MTSKSGDNKNVAHKAIAECVTDVLTTFWRCLWSVTEQIHGNMEMISLFYVIMKQGTTGEAFFNSQSLNLYKLESWASIAHFDKVTQK